MNNDRIGILDASIRDISSIPWQFDQIERLLDLDEELHGEDTPRCRDLVRRAELTIAQSRDNVRDQRRHLVDIAYRVDEELRKI